MRNKSHRGALVALAVAAICALVAAGAATGKDFVVVRQVLLTQSVHLFATYYVQRPAGCPATEPQPGSGNYQAQLRAWFSAFCDAYASQTADVTLRVYHNGRLVDSQDWQGYGGPSPSNRFSLRGYWDGYIYLWKVSPHGCADAGTYYWRVTMIDPYRRPGYTTSYVGSFPTHC